MKRILLNHDSEAGLPPAASAASAQTPALTGITAKMKMWDAPKLEYGNENVVLNAVYAEQGINKSWATSTPSGSLSLSINNPMA